MDFFMHPIITPVVIGLIVMLSSYFMYPEPPEHRHVDGDYHYYGPVRLAEEKRVEGILRRRAEEKFKRILLGLLIMMSAIPFELLISRIQHRTYSTMHLCVYTIVIPLFIAFLVMFSSAFMYPDPPKPRYVDPVLDFESLGRLRREEKERVKDILRFHRMERVRRFLFGIKLGFWLTIAFNAFAFIIS